MSGFIKLQRKILEWEWYQDANTFRLFIHLLLNANFEPRRWQGFEIDRGQLVVGLKKLSSELKLSVQEIRTSLKKLKTTHEITIKTTNKFSVVTICKYANYQDALMNAQQANQHSTQQTIHKQSTTTKEYKEGKETKNYNAAEFDHFWNTYNKKVGREKCLKEWKKISESDIKLILDHVPRYVDSTPDIQYRKNPLTYLNGKHWRDEIICRDALIQTSNKTINGRIKLAV